MTLVTPGKAPAMTGQFWRSLPPGRLTGSKQGGPGRDDPGPGGPGRPGQPGDLEAAVGIVDGVVRHQHLGRPGLEAQAGHRGERLRVGGGPQGGRGGEGGVDLDEHPVALADEGLHPSQGLYPLLDHHRPVRAPDDGHFPCPAAMARRL